MNRVESQNSCPHREAAVSYMYGELAAPESLAFEDHLASCEACTDDFAAIAESRFEIYEWQNIEFAPLPTPEFSIPYSTVSVGFFERLRAFWPVTPRYAAAAAAVAIVSSIFAVTMGFRALNNDEAAVSVENRTVAEPASSVSIPAEQLHEIKPAKPLADKDLSVAKTPNPERSPSRAAPKKPARSAAPSRRTVVRETEPPLPYLSEFPDDSDESLRLAEVLEDLGVGG